MVRRRCAVSEGNPHKSGTGLGNILTVQFKLELFENEHFGVYKKNRVHRCLLYF